MQTGITSYQHPEIGSVAMRSTRSARASASRLERRLHLGRTTMNPPRKFIRMLCVVGFALTATTSSMAATDDERFAAALQLHHDGHYSAAYGRLVALADGGNADAARIALLMVRFGNQLYDIQWSASASQIELWIVLASNQSPVVADGGD